VKLKKILKVPKKLLQAIEDYFTIPLNTRKLNVTEYIQRIDSGEWKNKLVFGVTDKSGDFLTIDPITTPGQVAIGGMGSGKSIGMKFTVFTHFLCNSENTLYIFVDAAKGMVDYKEAFPYTTNVVTALNTVDKFIPIMELLDDEIERRKFEFARVGAAKIDTYEEIMRAKDPTFPGLARIMLVFEEFHAIPPSKQVNFQMNIDRPGTSAYQLKNFMRAGRSFGCNAVLATQRFTTDDIPSTLKPGFNLIMAFKVNNAGDAMAANLPHVEQILSTQRGRCAWESGFMQFPYLDDKLAAKLMAERVKPLKAKLLGKQVSDYQAATSGEGTEGFIAVKPLVSLLEARSQFDIRLVARRFLSENGFECELQNNPALIAQLIATRDGDRFAVIITSDRDIVSSKMIANLKGSLEKLKCRKVLALAFDRGIDGGLASLCSVTGGAAADREDLEQFSKLKDHKEKFSDEEFLLKIAQFPLSREAMEKKKAVEVSSKGEDDEDVVEDEMEREFLNKSEKFMKRRLGTPDPNPTKYRG